MDRRHVFRIHLIFLLPEVFPFVWCFIFKSKCPINYFLLLITAVVIVIILRQRIHTYKGPLSVAIINVLNRIDIVL